MVVQLLSWAQRPVHVNWVIDPPISPTQLVLVSKAMVNLQAPDPIIAGSRRAIYIVVDDAREVGCRQQSHQSRRNWADPARRDYVPRELVPHEPPHAIRARSSRIEDRNLLSGCRIY